MSLSPSHYRIILTGLFNSLLSPKGREGPGRINMDEDTLKDDPRVTWGQLTDYDQPVTDGMEEGLVDFYKRRYITEETN